MKPKFLILVTTASVIMAKSALASILLFSDNFNEVNNNAATFNDNLDSTQSGLLVDTFGAITYNFTGFDWTTQHGNGNRLLVASGGPSNYGNVSLNYDFATIANNLNQALVFSFDVMEVSAFTDPTNWIAVFLDNAQNAFVTDGYAGSIFRQNGGTSFNNINWTPGNNVSIKMSDTNGTGSAFNGNGSVATLKIGNNAEQVISLSQQSSAFLTVNIIQWGGFGIGTIDNLTVTAVPEPSAALLSGLGVLGLLRRRRDSH